MAQTNICKLKIHILFVNLHLKILLTNPKTAPKKIVANAKIKYDARVGNPYSSVSLL